jgi:hypothetical protein
VNHESWLKSEHGIPDFLMPHFGQKTGFRDRMNEINLGFRALVEIVGNFMPDAARAATAKRRFSKTEKHFGPSI